MSQKTFTDKLNAQWLMKRFLMIGLDPDFSRLPISVTMNVSPEEAVFNFNKAIIDATHDLVLGYKAQNAFYEALGEAGHRALKRTSDYLKTTYPDLVTMLDAKRADIANSNAGYVTSAFEELGYDAITIHPYLGKEAVQPFLDCADRGIFVLVRTSNPGAAEFQDLIVDGEPLYMRVAKNVAATWNENGNCGVVVGATYPNELSDVRNAVGEMPILIPGVGAQGGDARKAYTLGKNSRGEGVIISVARSVIFASADDNFADAARNATRVVVDAIGV